MFAYVCLPLQILNAGSFFGRALSGPVAEYFGAIEVFVVSGILSGVVILALWTTTSVGVVGTIFGLFLYGFLSGKLGEAADVVCRRLAYPSPCSLNRRRHFSHRCMLCTTQSRQRIRSPSRNDVVDRQSALAGRSSNRRCSHRPILDKRLP